MPDFLNGCAMLTSGGERGGHPVDDHVGPAAGDDLRRRDVGPARLDRHVEAGLLVEAFVLGDVVACELGLGDPFELDGHLVRLREGGARKAQSDGARE